ncbi:hypothetical protein FBU59_003210, partial [Linderina macrospora]
METVIHNITYVTINNYIVNGTALDTHPSILVKRKGSQSDNNNGGIDINQIDLFSGVPALLALIVGFLQFLPDPTRGYRTTLLQYIRWLRRQTEQEFGITLRACEKNCHTTSFRVSQSSIEERAKADVDEEDPPICHGQQLLRIDDLVKIIQNGNADAFMCLARVTRYVHLKELEKAARVISYIPKSGRRIVAWQWIHVAVKYSFFVLFYGAVAQFFSRLFSRTKRTMQVLLRTNPDKQNPDIPDLYKMSILSQHKLVCNQLPWVQFGVYSLLSELADKRITFRLKDRDEEIGRTGGTANDESLDLKESTEDPIRERRLLTMLFTDHCSAAQCMAAIGIQAIRVALLRKYVGSMPLHLVCGLWGSLRITQGDGYMVFQHDKLANNFMALYGLLTKTTSIRHTATETSDIYGGISRSATVTGSSWKKSRARKPPAPRPVNHRAVYYEQRYRNLLRMLNSPLGEAVSSEFEFVSVLNLSLVNLNRGLDGKSRFEPNCEIFGVPMPQSTFDKICRSQDRMIWIIDTILNHYQTWTIHWSISSWTLRLLYIIQREIPHTTENKERHHTNQGRTAALCISGFQHKYHLWLGKVRRAIARRESGTATWSWLAEKLFTSEAVTPRALYVSNPEWCTCVSQCDGTCTLLANTFDLFIPEGYYLTIPYLLASETRTRTLLCTRDIKYVSEALEHHRLGDAASEIAM